MSSPGELLWLDPAELDLQRSLHGSRRFLRRNTEVPTHRVCSPAILKDRDWEEERQSIRRLRLRMRTQFRARGGYRVPVHINRAWPRSGARLLLTVFERISLGSSGHLLMAALTALRAIRWDYYGDKTSCLSVIGPSVLLHGTQNFIALSFSASDGNVGWIHPTGFRKMMMLVGTTLGMIGVGAGLVHLLYVYGVRCSSVKIREVPFPSSASLTAPAWLASIQLRHAAKPLLRRESKPDIYVYM